MERILAHTKKARGGFTLMEMLIVVAIIAVLTSIAIPVFSDKLENVREKADLADAKNIETALKAYYLTTAGDDNLTSKNKVFNRNVGYVYVNEDGARCAGNAHLALIAAGIGAKADWKRTGDGEYVSSVLKCRSKKNWVKYQIEYKVADDGDIAFTGNASKISGYSAGGSGSTDLFSKALGIAYDKDMPLGGRR